MSELNKLETVYTVTGYYDGVLDGIADFHGKPHIFAAAFSEEIDDYARGEDGYDSYWLQPIDEETFRLAMEDWEIWLRWSDAFHSGKTQLATHPALPEDRPRHEIIKAAIGNRLKIDQANSIKARGRFVPKSNKRWAYEVTWKDSK